MYCMHVVYTERDETISERSRRASFMLLVFHICVLYACSIHRETDRDALRQKALRNLPRRSRPFWSHNPFQTSAAHTHTHTHSHTHTHTCAWQTSSSASAWTSARILLHASSSSISSRLRSSARFLRYNCIISCTAFASSSASYLCIV